MRLLKGRGGDPLSTQPAQWRHWQRVAQTRPECISAKGYPAIDLRSASRARKRITSPMLSSLPAAMSASGARPENGVDRFRRCSHAAVSPTASRAVPTSARALAVRVWRVVNRKRGRFPDAGSFPGYPIRLSASASGIPRRSISRQNAAEDIVESVSRHRLRGSDGQPQRLAKRSQVGIARPAVVGLPEVDARRTHTDPFRNFRNRQPAPDTRITQVACEVDSARQCNLRRCFKNGGTIYISDDAVASHLTSGANVWSSIDTEHVWQCLLVPCADHRTRFGNKPIRPIRIRYIAMT